MTNTQIELKIVELVSQSKNYTPFLLKREFGTRDHKKVTEALTKLEAAGVLHTDPDYFLLLGAKKVTVDAKP